MIDFINKIKNIETIKYKITSSHNKKDNRKRSTLRVEKQEVLDKILTYIRIIYSKI